MNKQKIRLKGLKPLATSKIKKLQELNVKQIKLLDHSNTIDSEKSAVNKCTNTNKLTLKNIDNNNNEEEDLPDLKLSNAHRTLEKTKCKSNSKIIHTIKDNLDCESKKDIFEPLPLSPNKKKTLLPEITSTNSKRKYKLNYEKSTLNNNSNNNKVLIKTTSEVLNKNTSINSTSNSNSNRYKCKLFLNNKENNQDKLTDEGNTNSNQTTLNQLTIANKSKQIKIKKHLHKEKISACYSINNIFSSSKSNFNNVNEKENKSKDKNNNNNNPIKLTSKNNLNRIYSQGDYKNNKNNKNGKNKIIDLMKNLNKESDLIINKNAFSPNKELSNKLTLQLRNKSPTEINLDNQDIIDSVYSPIQSISDYYPKNHNLTNVSSNNKLINLLDKKNNEKISTNLKKNKKIMLPKPDFIFNKNISSGKIIKEKLIHHKFESTNNTHNDGMIMNKDLKEEEEDEDDSNESDSISDIKETKESTIKSKISKMIYNKNNNKSNIQHKDEIVATSRISKLLTYQGLLSFYSDRYIKAKLSIIPPSIDIPIICIGYNTNNGTIRDYNEDTLTIKQIPHLNCYYFAIYDGHGGSACSFYLQKNLHNYIKSLSRKDLEEAIDRCEQDFFKKIAFKKKNQNNSSSTESSNMNLLINPNHYELQDPSGSCANIVIVTSSNLIYSINIGDSRTIMINNKKEITYCTIDHKPSNENEKERIKLVGGSLYQNSNYDVDDNGDVINGPLRVYPSGLSVSRTVGDAEAKFEFLGGIKGTIVSTPDIKFFDNSIMKTKFIIMGCDGIFDVLNNDEVIHCVYLAKQNCTNNKYYCDVAADFIIKGAMIKSSSDNVSSIVIEMKDS